ncbi:hypothetical protein [Streptomyces sp. MnatMP-M27]|uniref:hypothetical protein n=1 Tax=Streptomyces sp. MnatMP-M27 TaxID=1839768 RepID=UPI00351E3403
MLGLYLSYAYNLAAGGLIVLVVTGVFIVCWLLAPRHGLLTARTHRRGHALAPDDVAAATAQPTDNTALVERTPAG